MLQTWLSGASLLDLPVLAMCAFLAFFLAVLWRVTRRRHRDGYQQMAQLPLQDDTDGSILS
jgi:cbb3-type cytochrome oxidase subunit 3